MMTPSPEHPGEAGRDDVSFEEMQRLRQGSAVTLIDVLPRGAFQEARIAGSINLPLAEISEGAQAVLPDPTAEIVVYCGSFT
jgi:rhodanese-related sulfurtransferase